MTKRLAVVGASALMLTALVAASAVAVARSSGPGPGSAERPAVAEATAPLTATVTRTVVQQHYVFTGTLTARSTSRPLPVSGVVSGVPVGQGKIARTGRSVLEVNGRPVIALRIPFPLWRDLEPGMQGKDVRVVQRALRDLGLLRARPNGTFGPATQDAVRRLYAGLDYPAPTMGGADDAAAAEPGTAAGGEAAGASESTGTAEAQPDTPTGASHRRIVLPSVEVVALGGGPWRLDLSGAVTGSVVAQDDGPRLVGVGSRLEVDDDGQLAALLGDDAVDELTLVTGDGGTDLEVGVVSATVRDSVSVVVVRPSAGGLLESGSTSGTAVAASSDGRVLAVPVTALRPAPDGRILVRLATSTGARDVEVTVGLRGDRLVEVRGADLNEGAQVELP